MLDIYSQRDEYLGVDPEMLNYNFVKFVSMFTLKGKKLTRRSKDVIVKTYPNYSSSPTNPHYGVFCKYQLLKYKPRKGTPTMACNNFELNDETFITSWKQYLSCEQSKQLVTNSKTKMEDLNGYLVAEDDCETQECDEEKEEWMLMAELNLEIENEYAQSLIVPEEYWSDQRKKYSLKQIGEMPSWNSQLKKRANSNWCVSQQE